MPLFASRLGLRRSCAAGWLPALGLGCRHATPSCAALGCRAAWLGDTAAIGEYAAAGGDVNAADHKGQTPLQFAAGGLRWRV